MNSPLIINRKTLVIWASVFSALLLGSLFFSFTCYTYSAVAGKRERQLAAELKVLQDKRKLKDEVMCDQVTGPDGCDYLLFNGITAVHSGACTNPIHGLQAKTLDGEKGGE